MKCPEVKHWLLGAKAEDPLPGSVLQHLQACAACRDLRQRLVLVDAAVRQVPVPGASAASRRRLDRRLRAQPRLRRARLRLTRRAAAGLAAASVLLALGWLIGRYTAATYQERLWAAPRLPSADTVPARRSDELALVLRMVQHDVRLAEVTQRDEQLERLLMLAGDLRDAAILLLRQGNPDEVPQLAELYQHVLRHGLARRARDLPADARARIVPALAQKLRTADGQLDGHAREALPLTAELLRPMREATRETLDLLESGRAPGRPEPSLPAVRDPSRLLATLVLSGLKLTEENDPISRADLCADLASRVVPSVILLSSGSDLQEAGDLGECLATLLNRGVIKNLDQAETKTILEARLVEMEKVRHRLLQVIALLDQNLAHAPPAARTGLQQAMKVIDAARKERGVKAPAAGPPAAPAPDRPPAPEGPRGEGADIPQGDAEPDPYQQAGAMPGRPRHAAWL